jgi:RNA polymerase sigma factor (sigma-70 family)
LEVRILTAHFGDIPSLVYVDHIAAWNAILARPGPSFSATRLTGNKTMQPQERNWYDSRGSHSRDALDLDDCFDVIRAEAGPSEAREEAAERVLAYLICIAAAYEGQEAHDVVHDWWIRRLPGLRARYDGRATFRSYAGDSLRRFCLEFRRRQPRGLRHLTGDVPDDRQDLLMKVWQSDLRAKLNRAAWQLPESQRITLQLVYVDGLSSKEAAELLRCSIEAVNTRLSRAREELRRLLEDLGDFL